MQKVEVLIMSAELVCDVTDLQKDDVVHYFTTDNGEFILEQGMVVAANLYTDGVDVHGDGWQQYVSKWFICKVERAGVLIFAK